ncbi:MAG: potassium transporter KtrB [Lachnospiraceae bacterium]|nr:potassium transporter KtrB [Lachnospiraceae bacterium]MDE6697906.1 potassium transporter KtrB [Lachnospiraceae bacterium]
MKKGRKKKNFNTTRWIAVGFLLVILWGTIMLSLPVSASDGKATNIIDALFTSTTSVCVTGLTTVVTATHWSIFGKSVILLLIQLGGLGVICCMIAVLMLFRVKLNMREKVMIQESYSFDSIEGMNKIIPRVFKGTMLVEGIGAILYCFAFIPRYGILKGIWYSVFHSVSAFCNAGIDLIGDSSFISFSNNTWISFVTMFLIIAGGIGFIVWWDLKAVISEAFKKRKFKGQLFKRLTIHSKVAITVTIALILAGAVLIFAFEYNNVATIGNYSPGEKIVASLFQSVTARTAGFAGIIQDSFRLHTYIIIMVLMLIGGSPMGTAGGLKTTTIAMMFICVLSVIRGKRDTEVFDRRISRDNIRTGLTVVVVGVSILLLGIIALSITDNFTGIETSYECVSAIATVGLSTGITPMLSTAGKFIIIVMMFIGRIGPITIAMAIGGKKINDEDSRQLPKKRIIVG